jgi:hypothetical protein
VAITRVCILPERKGSSRRYWQAGHAPEPQAGAGPLPSFAPESPSAFAAGFAPPPLKSVAYQPLPFSWNPAAVTIFANVSWPHSVQRVCGASLSFWRNSCWWPQLEQRYSYIGISASEREKLSF